MKTIKPRLLVFASGSAEGGGSGFEKLVQATRSGLLIADIVGVVSNHAHGGVYHRANKYGIPFVHFPKPWDAEAYQKIAKKSKADFFPLSGWLKQVMGLDPNTRFNSRTVFNIHPGPLPKFGGPGLYGHHVHEAVMAAYRRGEVTHSAVTMHFVTEEYDQGPAFFRLKIKIEKDDTPETLGMRINQYEHQYQARITNLVVNDCITWDGVNPLSLQVPDDYNIERFAM